MSYVEMSWNELDRRIEKAYNKGRNDAIDEYSNKLFSVIEQCTVNCKFDFNIDDLHNLEVVIKGLAEEMKEGAWNGSY